MPSLFSKYNHMARALNAIVTSGGRNPFAVTIEKMLSSTTGIIEGKETLLFGTNNYLGLSQSKDAIKDAQNAVLTYGIGTTGSRIANGTFSLHRQLERHIADFFGKREAIVFSTGYQAKLGMISALAGKDDYLFLDADSHASIYDGSRLSAAQVIRFRHNDPDDLYKRIRRLNAPEQAKLIVVEGIYSMTGNIAPIREFVAVKKETDSALLVDEAHSFGVLGEHGRGVAEADGVEHDVDFIVGTFSKSLGTVGGYCVSDHQELDLLRLNCRPYMFTASLPPEIIAATTATLHEMQAHPELRTYLMNNAAHLRSGFVDLGLHTSQQVSPVIAVTLETEEQAILMWNELLNLGVYVNLSLPPATPDSRPLLRCSVMATHTADQIDQAISVFRQAAIKAGVIS